MDTSGEPSSLTVTTSDYLTGLSSSKSSDYESAIRPRMIIPGPKDPDGTQPNTNGMQPFLFPPCDPYGCDDVGIAPIECDNCRKVETSFAVLGMFLLSFVIVVANFLVIRVILRTPSLRRRHGYIKLSLATSDLLVGLLVIPSAIANLFLTLYCRHEGSKRLDKIRIKQINSTGSVVFGVIAIISVLSSLYNLLLLSIDRFLAISRPLRHKAGRYFPRRSLWLSICAVWIFSVILSMVPAFLPDKVTYEMDLATFFFVQRVQSDRTSSFSSVYIGVVIGGPYVLTVLLIILTALYTWKHVKSRQRLSNRGNMTKSAIQRKCERKNRIKMIQEAYPDALMEDDMHLASIKDYDGKVSRNGKVKGWKDLKNSSSSERRSWLTWWKNEDCVFGSRSHNINNNSNGSEDSIGSQSPRYQRTRDQMSIVREILNPPKAPVNKFNNKKHVRVFKMLLAMIISYSFCLLPYLVVMLVISDSYRQGQHGITAAYIFAIYMVFINSLSNFVIYNLLHPEFRCNLHKILREDLSKPAKIKNSITATFSSSADGTSNDRRSTATTSLG